MLTFQDLLNGVDELIGRFDQACKLLVADDDDQAFCTVVPDPDRPAPVSKFDDFMRSHFQPDRPIELQYRVQAAASRMGTKFPYFGTHNVVNSLREMTEVIRLAETLAQSYGTDGSPRHPRLAPLAPNSRLLVLLNQWRLSVESQMMEGAPQ